MTEPLGELLRRLQRVLEEERALLLAGRPQRLGSVVERKLQLARDIERVWAEPGAVQPEREMLLRLERLNRANAVICGAVLRQLTRTLDRLRRHESHRSYRADGGERSPSATSRIGAA